MIASLLAATVTLVIPPPPVLNADKMLDAIAQVEHWDKKTAGKAGEWGDWQMLPAVFRKYSTVNPRACAPNFMRMVAMKHMLFLVAEIRRHHHSVTPFSLGLAWGGGVSLVWAKTVPAAKFEYAERCAAIYESLAQ